VRTAPAGSIRPFRTPHAALRTFHHAFGFLITISLTLGARAPALAGECTGLDGAPARNHLLGGATVMM
jgi:hypothetical protein